MTVKKEEEKRERMSSSLHETVAAADKIQSNWVSENTVR
jgi:hypothetical protein